MEECEALCDKLGIMLNGQMQCYGTIPELKRKYGDGYRLIIKCNHSENLEKGILNLDNFIRTNFPTAFLEGNAVNASLLSRLSFYSICMS